MPLQGDVATLPVRELFGMLARTRASGRLSLSRGMAARRFHLRDGRVLNASSSEEQTRLGRLLVDRGLIGKAELDRVLEDRGPAARARLGRTLTEEGLVSPTALAGVLAEKIERMLVDSLSWKDGQFYFDEEAVPPRRSSTTAVAATVDLERVLATPSSFPAPKADTIPVADADVLEVLPLPASSSIKSKRTATAAKTRRRSD